MQISRKRLLLLNVGENVMDWFNEQSHRPEKVTKISECYEIINHSKILLKQEKERAEFERLRVNQEKIRARKEYLVNKYGDKFTLAELEEFELVFQAKISQEHEKEKSRLKKLEEEERQLKRDLYR